MSLVDLLPDQASADSVYEAFLGWTTEQGLSLYPHQEEAAIELFSGNNVILATPTGSGKSTVAVAAHFAALADGRTSFYTAPIKALVSEKFFALCTIFGAENVGMLTGDATVNGDAPIVCCTAEVLANMALREGAESHVDQVVMDEFHFYADPQRGWAWQVPLLTLPRAQFLLMSATLGDVAALREDVTRRTGRPTALVDDAERPVPLEFTWSLDPLHELLETLVHEEKAPVYAVHFTQASALERAQSLLSGNFCTVGEQLGLHGAAILPAIAVGYEISNRVSASLQRGPLAERLMFGLGTWQSIGTAATVGYLLGLDASQLAHALAITACNAPVPSAIKTCRIAADTGAGSDLRPTSVKNNFGMAVWAGMTGAMLAREGLTGPLDVFEGHGFWRWSGAVESSDSELRAPDGEWSIRQINFKDHPTRPVAGS